VGEECGQRFSSDPSLGNDCLKDSLGQQVACEFIHDQFLCGDGAVPAGTLMCMGT
jgi:hypothetical protein